MGVSLLTCDHFNHDTISEIFVMEIVILLATIYLLNKIKNVNDKNELKLVVASVMGLTFFFVWPYVHYMTQLLLWSETYIYITYLVLLSIAMVIVVLISMIPINVYTPVFSLV